MTGDPLFRRLLYSEEEFIEKFKDLLEWVGENKEILIGLENLILQNYGE